MNHKFAKVHAFLLWKHGVTGEGFIRQQWRMWIETDKRLASRHRLAIHSPAMANVD